MRPGVRALRERLLPWYDEHKRDLPWRKTRDPYALVVAEMMLQQTGVERIVPRWVAFIERFPTWQALATATVGDVIVEWRGLGYNRRAIALHRIAQAVVADFGGRLPADRDQLLRLPGIGRYTASAILSFIHGQDVPAIDVNLQRVIGRVVLGRGDAPLADVERIAGDALPPGQSGEWNQALMDFASIQCTLRRPACLFCPLRDACAFAGTVADIVKPSRLAADRPAPYVGSRRYVRGRVVDAARLLPVGGTLTRADVEAIAGDVDAKQLLAGLLRDGLLAQVGESYRLP